MVNLILPARPPRNVKIRRRKDWVDISGRRFGRLLAVGSIMRDGREHWACWCDCGKQATPRKSELLERSRPILRMLSRR